MDQRQDSCVEERVGGRSELKLKVLKVGGRFPQSCNESRS
jgi:hypothetical protein